MQWTSELSGLATGRNVVEYLQSGKNEEEALRVLFQAVTPGDGVKIFLECTGTLLRGEATEGEMKRKAIGSWSRVVLLGNRILNEQAFSDADPDLKRAIQSSISGALSWPTVLKGGYEMAVLLCLCRKIFVCGELDGDDDSTVQRLKPYESWLKDLVRQSDTKTVEAILRPLSEIVPLEPLQLLRLNHRVFSSRRDVFKIVSDFLITVRSRISDLNPARTVSFLQEKGTHSTTNGGNRTGQLEVKVIKDIISFVSEFAGTKIVSSTLAGQMNFQRYHFRAVTLPALLDENLTDCIKKEEDVSFETDANTFDKHRIGLIRELAFKRKDHAVSTAEAKIAIKAIKKAIAERKASKKKKGGTVKEPHHEAFVTDASSMKDIFSAVLRQKAETDFQEFNPEPNTPHRLLLEKIQGELDAIKEEEGRQTFSLKMLQCINQCVVENDRYKSSGIHSVTWSQDVNAILSAYKEWWASCGTILMKFLPYLLGDPAVRVLQKHMQYQLFALVCTSSKAISYPSLLSLAMITTVLMKLSDNDMLKDLCVCSVQLRSPRLKDLFSCIVQHLPFTSDEAVGNSVVYAFYCSCLLISNVATQYFTQPYREGTFIGVSTTSAMRRESSNGHDYSRNTPQILSDILRWALRTPSRLLIIRNGMDLISGKRRATYISWILETISKLLISGQLMSNPDGSLLPYLTIEARCGSGEASSIHSLFCRLEENKVPAHRLALDAVIFISRTWKQVNSCYTWINDGLVRYSRDISWCESIEEDMSGSEWSVIGCVEQNFSKYGSGVGRKMFDWLQQIDVCYFHGCKQAEVGRHISRYILPYLWPFSRCHANYIMRCLGRKCVDGGKGWVYTRDNFLALSSLVVQVEKWRPLDDNFHSQCASKSQRISQKAGAESLWSTIGSVQQVLEELFRRDGHGEDGLELSMQSNQERLFSNCLQRTPRVLGSCIVLRLWTELRRRRGGNEGRKRVEWVVDRIRRKCGKLWENEVIDTAIGTACILPFTGGIVENGDFERADVVTKDMIGVLCVDRIRNTIKNGEGVNWLEEDLEASLTKSNMGDCIGSIVSWGDGSGFYQQGQTDRTASNGGVHICLARLFGSLADIPDECIGDWLFQVGAHKAGRNIVSNVLSCYKRLSAGFDVRECSIGIESKEEIEKQREHIRTKLVEAVKKLFCIGRRRLGEEFARIVGDVVKDMGSCGEEVRWVLEAFL